MPINANANARANSTPLSRLAEVQPTTVQSSLFAGRDRKSVFSQREQDPLVTFLNPNGQLGQGEAYLSSVFDLAHVTGASPLEMNERPPFL